MRVRTQSLDELLSRTSGVAVLPEVQEQAVVDARRRPLQVGLSIAIVNTSSATSTPVRGRPGPRFFEPSYFRATSRRYHARMVSGVTIPATSLRTFRPKALPLTAKRRRWSSVRRRRRPPSCSRDASRYEPVNRQRRLDSATSAAVRLSGLSCVTRSVSVIYQTVLTGSYCRSF